MIIGKNFFIIEMPKTGTTFLRNYFKQYKNIKLSAHHDTVDENQTIKSGYKPNNSTSKIVISKKTPQEAYNEINVLAQEARNFIIDEVNIHENLDLIFKELYGLKIKPSSDLIISSSWANLDSDMLYKLCI